MILTLTAKVGAKKNKIYDSRAPGVSIISQDK